MYVTLDDKVINVILIRKKIKNIYFRFDESLNLIVTSPKHVTAKEIQKLIQENKESLTKMYTKISKRIIKDNELWYLGQKYTLKCSDVNEVLIGDNIITAPSLEAFNQYVYQEITQIFTKEVEYYKTLINPPRFTLKIRKMKTKWGVCNYQKKTITLNTELIKYPIEALKYVIVHEMCHFYHHNHGQEFWALVEHYYPNYKEMRKELRT